MRKLMAIILASIVFNLNFACHSPQERPDTGVHNATRLIVTPGESWRGTMKLFVFSMAKIPQMAAWIEDSDGRYVSTITVTKKTAREKWISAPKEGRPSALPVWKHRQMNSKDIDAASTATPKGSVTANINQNVLINGNTYNVYFEVNHSFDYNDYWTKDNSDVNGQPSLVYHASFVAGQPGHIQLVPIGHGSVDGSDGTINNNLESVTGALGIIADAMAALDM